MSRNQFELKTSFLHCYDNTRLEDRRGNPAYDPLQKFRIFLDGLNSSCKGHYVHVPIQLIAVNESVIGRENRTKLVQYIPNKHHELGVELYSIIASSTGYPVHTMVYCSKQRSAPASEHGHSYNVVMKLLPEANSETKGYDPFVDNFYTSPTVAQQLHENEVQLTESLRSSRCASLPASGKIISLGNCVGNVTRFMAKNIFAVINTALNWN